jgi:thiol-disulfide isomerase/thioredoxin
MDFLRKVLYCGGCALDDAHTGDLCAMRMMGALVLVAGLFVGGWAQAQDSAMKTGAEYEKSQQWPAAADSYRAALKASGGKCVVCLAALERMQMKLEMYKDAAGSAARLAAMAAGPAEKSQAEALEGMAFYREYFAETGGATGEKTKGDDKAGKKAEGALKQAEESLRAAVADAPSNEATRMLHGRMLAALRQDEQAQKEFEACAAAPGASAQECARAQKFAKNVALARGESAPAFEVKSMDGKTVSLDVLAGKVVLVDFWATWCTWCRRDSDYVQSMLDSFDSDKFVLLEVDVDDTEAPWLNYVKQERLHGVQVRDASNELRDKFHVKAFPTYVILDGDGVVQEREEGARGDLRGEVRKLLATAPLESGKATKVAGVE